MTNTNITNFRKDIYELLETTIKYNEPINVSTKNGNAIVLSEEDYNGLIETVNLLNIQDMKEKLIKENPWIEEKQDIIDKYYIQKISINNKVIKNQK